MPRERRVGTRHEAHVPAIAYTDGGVLLGTIRDESNGGLFLEIDAAHLGEWYFEPENLPLAYGATLRVSRRALSSHATTTTNGSICWLGISARHGCWGLGISVNE